MRVNELIKHLKKLDPNSDVVVEIDTSGKPDDWGVYYLKISDIAIINVCPKIGMPQALTIATKNSKPVILLK